MKSFENTPANPNDVASGEIEETREKLPEPVYYIESPDDDTVLIGVDVTIERDGNSTEAARISWYDTARERIMTAAETKQEDGYFAFKRSEAEGGGTYYFAPMDLETYNNEVRERLAGGQTFESNEELIQAFLATLEDEF